MARIKEYVTQVGAAADIGGRRAQTGDFFQPGDDGSGLINAAAQIEDAVQRQEVSTVTTREAEFRTKWTVDFKNRADEAEIGDPTFAEKFNEDFGNALSGFDNDIRTAAGRRAAAQAKAGLAAHFTSAAGLYQAESMGKKAVLDYSRALDANRNTLIQDPVQFPQILAASERALNDPDGLYANLPAVKRAELAESTRKELAMSAVQGVIARDPKFALDQLEKGEYAEYLDADKTIQLKRSAEISIRANELESARLEAAAQKKRRDAEIATEDALVKQWITDPTSLSPRDIGNSNLSVDDKIKWVGPGGILERGGRGGSIATDPATFINLFNRIHLPESDPRKITEESDLLPYFGNGLTMDNISALRSELSGRKTEAGRIEADLKKGVIDVAKSTLTGTNQLLGIHDPRGDEQLQKFMSYFLPEYAAQRAKGKTPVELLDPDSPDYLGKALERFKRTPQQAMNDLMRDNKGTGASEAVRVTTDDIKTGALRARAIKTARSADGQEIYYVKEGLLSNPVWVDIWGRPATPAAKNAPSETTPPALAPPIAGAKNGAAPANDLPTPATPAEADKLMPGTHFRAPDGSVRVKGYRNAEDVQRAYKAGIITRDQAAKILKEKGWAK